MTALEDKIYANIVEQLTIKLKAEKLNNELQSLDRRGQTIVGRMSVLAELYEEQTGRNLDQDINKDERWGQLVQKAQREAQIAAADPNPTDNPNLAAPPAPRPVKAVAENKQPKSKPQPTLPPPPQPPQPTKMVQKPDNEADALPSVGKVVVEDAAQEAPKPQNKSALNNREQPINFTIDDQPPTPQKGEQVVTTNLEDDD